MSFIVSCLLQIGDVDTKEILQLLVQFQSDKFGARIRAWSRVSTRTMTTTSGRPTSSALSRWRLNRGAVIVNVPKKDKTLAVFKQQN